MDLPREVKVEGVGTVKIDPDRDFVGDGGQAVIYKVAPKLVGKLFFDPEASKTKNKVVLKPDVMAQGDFVGKLKTLMGLKDPRIVKPQGLISTTKGQLLGYTMAFENGITLPEAFTQGFWRDHGWTGKEAVSVSESMREVVAYAHTKQALLVDNNPGNTLLVNTKQWEPRVLDVDAWQIGKWPANAAHPLTSDPTTKGFSTLTDWFGWGTVVCQLILNVHPYGGMLSGFKPSDIEGRMQAGKSIFEPGVRLGNGVRDFSLCPPALLQWLRDTYLGGKREVPPSLYAHAPAVAVAARVARVVASPVTGMLAFTRLYGDVSDPVQRIYPGGVVRLRSGTLVSLGSRKVIGSAMTARAEVVRQEGGWLLAEKVGVTFSFHWLSENQPMQAITNFPAMGEGLVVAQTGPAAVADRLFIVTEDGLQELETMQVGTKALVGYGPMWPALPSARWYQGCGIQQMLGRTHLLLPYGPRQYTTLAVPELAGFKPVAAMAAFGVVLVVVQNKKGEMFRFELALNATHTGYALQKDQVTDGDLNVTLRPDGTYRAIWEDGALTIAKPAANKVVTRKDGGIRLDMALASWSQVTLYLQDGVVWSLQGK